MSSVVSMHRSRYRTIFISDTHLGFRGARADALHDFLDAVDCDTLYLVGDVFDIWEMERGGIYWPESHDRAFRRILEHARNGTRVIYVPGNHDERVRPYADSVIGRFEIQRQAEHELADGRRMLVLHGDEFDTVVQASRFLGRIGSRLYAWLLRVNVLVNGVRRIFGFPHWSLASHVKYRVKNAMKYIAGFEEAVAREARRRKMDGVICGHIHHAEIREIEGVLYCNDGDWVESCTALVEDHGGQLSLLRWPEADAASAPALTTRGVAA